ncbi:MAG: hypothetical protein FJX57_21285 [Alphaproteobacteria bacterium]|nr:hypothetical protein [Alphaproteobacteria bacterium]
MARDEPQVEPSTLFERESSRSNRQANANGTVMTAGILLLALTLGTATLYNLWQGLGDRDALRRAYANLEAPHQQAIKVRAQVESIARQLARLAQDGNANAREVVEALRRQGITINPN